MYRYITEIVLIVLVVSLSACFRFAFLPDELASWILTFLFFLLLSILTLVPLATIHTSKNGLRIWLHEHQSLAMFEGLLGHTIVAMVGVIVAGGIYERIETEHRQARICTEAKPLHDIGSSEQPILVHVRDGVGKAKDGQPLLVRWIRMHEEGTEYCAMVRYARKLGFQYKIFVKLGKKPSTEQLQILNDAFGPPALGSDDPPHDAYVTVDQDTENKVWRVWVLLKDRGYYAEEDLQLRAAGESTPKIHIWNNFFPPSDDDSH